MGYVPVITLITVCTRLKEKSSSACINKHDSKSTTENKQKYKNSVSGLRIVCQLLLASC